MAALDNRCISSRENNTPVGEERAARHQIEMDIGASLARRRVESKTGAPQPQIETDRVGELLRLTHLKLSDDCCSSSSAPSSSLATNRALGASPPVTSPVPALPAQTQPAPVPGASPRAGIHASGLVSSESRQMEHQHQHQQYQFHQPNQFEQAVASAATEPASRMAAENCAFQQQQSNQEAISRTSEYQYPLAQQLPFGGHPLCEFSGPAFEAGYAVSGPLLEGFEPSQFQALPVGFVDGHHLHEHQLHHHHHHHAAPQFHQTGQRLVLLSGEFPAGQPSDEGVEFLELSSSDSRSGKHEFAQFNFGGQLQRDSGGGYEPVSGGYIPAPLPADQTSAGYQLASLSDELPESVVRLNDHQQERRPEAVSTIQFGGPQQLYPACGEPLPSSQQRQRQQQQQQQQWDSGHASSASCLDSTGSDPLARVAASLEAGQPELASAGTGSGCHLQSMEPELRVCEWEGCEHTFLDMHLFVKHLEERHVNQEPKEKNRFFCLWANCKRNAQEFNARYKLLIHMRVHSGDKPYPCNTGNCKKSFSRLENLKIHVRSHTGEKPYKCNYDSCSKSFTNSSDRIKHHKTHKDPKPYSCSHAGCSKRYTDPSSLRKHLRAHKRAQTGEPAPVCAADYDPTCMFESVAGPSGAPPTGLPNQQQQHWQYSHSWCAGTTKQATSGRFEHPAADQQQPMEPHNQTHYPQQQQQHHHHHHYQPQQAAAGDWRQVEQQHQVLMRSMPSDFLQTQHWPAQ